MATEPGASREAFSRLLKAFEQRGLVRLSRGAVRLLNKTGLRRIVGESVDITGS